MRYFKQAWNLIRQEKLFSSIYIIGTGLAITMVMVLSIVFYIRIGNIYPETNRDRMLIIKVAEEAISYNTRSADLSYSVANSFRSLPSVEAVAVVQESNANYVQLPGGKEELPILIKYTNEDFWKVFSFQFKEGAPFGEAEVQSGIKTAVIAQSLATKVFGTTNPVGRHISLNHEDYRVAGVVRDVSFATPQSYAQAWIPATVKENYAETWAITGFLGFWEAYILSPSLTNMEQTKQEVIDHVKRYNTNYPDAQLSLMGQPDRQWQSIFRSWKQPDYGKIILQYGLIFFGLLFVPAVSLSGMADSRMERRLAELGVRRAFGAPRGKLMRQVISENFVYTLFGGIFGLLLSYLILFITKDWILQIGNGFNVLPPEGVGVVLPATMMINLPVFLIALAVCFILNLLASFLPAWKASRKAIIYSLNIQ